MARAKVNLKFREQLSEKLMDLGNLVITGSVLGQLISGMEISVPLMLGGLITATSCYILSFIITQK